MATSEVGKPAYHKVTTALAKEWATMRPCPGDRGLSKHRLAAYRKKAAAGQFRSPVVWGRALAVETGLVYRVNGKHTSTVFAEMAVPPDVYVSVHEWRCDTLADVAELYATFDSREGVRSVADVTAPFAAAVPALADLNRRFVSAAVSGIWYYKLGDKYASVSAEARAQVLSAEVDFVLFLNDLCYSAARGPGMTPLQKLGRMPVIAAVYGTFKKDSDAAAQFWTGVRDETSPTLEAPDRALADFLKTHRLATTAGGPMAKQYQGSAREFLAKCVYAWNAWREDRLVKQFRYTAGAPAPKIV